MSKDSPKLEDENTGSAGDIEGRGDEGQRAAAASDKIGQDAVPGQTQTPAPADDVGVPPDEEMNRDDS